MEPLFGLNNMISFEAIFWIVVVLVLLYVGVRQYRASKEEHFEKRDN